MRRQIAPSDFAATNRTPREVRTIDPDVLHAYGAKGGASARTIGTLLRASGTRVARILFRRNVVRPDYGRAADKADRAASSADRLAGTAHRMRTATGLGLAA
jgi:hypothetical protein